MSRKLKLAPGLSIPVQAVTETFGFMARRGGGKTYCAQKLAEEMLDAGAQIVALDPIGNWWSLRLDADGKSPGYDIPVFGGLRGDIPLAADKGRLVADTVADTGTSVVLDVSQFSKADRKRFVADFCERLFMRRKAEPSPTHLFLEECQAFCPERVTGGDARMVGAVQDIVRMGRNHGLGVTMISQRPQSVNKEILNMTEVLFMMQTSGKHERKALEGWIDHQGVDAKQVVADLPTLAPGEAWCSSPQLLRILKRVKIGRKKTYDASSAPRVGAKVSVKKIKRLDMKRLEKAMEKVIEGAEAKDPAKLRKEIARLERELKKKGGPVGITPQERKEIEAAAEARGYNAGVTATHRAFVQASRDLPAMLQENVRDNYPVPVKLIGKVSAKPTFRRPNGRDHTPPPVKARATAASSGTQAPARQRILDALAWLEAFGIEQADRAQLAFLAKQKPTSGGYKNHLGAMRSEGLLSYPSGGKVQLTDAGRAEANEQEEPATTAELQRRVLERLAPARQRIIQPLIEAYPNYLMRDELADLAEQKATSGGYKNHLGAMRSLGLLDYPNPGAVQASEILFLDGDK